MIIIIIPTHLVLPSVPAPVIIIDIGPHVWVIVMLIFPPNMPNAQPLRAPVRPLNIDLPTTETIIFTAVMDFRHVSNKMIFQEQQHTNHELVTVSLLKEITFMTTFIIVIIMMNFLSPWN